MQVIQEYVALLKLGHMLVFETPDGGNSPSAGDVDCSLTTEVRYRLPDGTVKTATVSLMFPASSGSVSRIMDSWYAARGELLAILYLLERNQVSFCHWSGAHEGVADSVHEHRSQFEGVYFLYHRNAEVLVKIRGTTS